MKPIWIIIIVVVAIVAIYGIYSWQKSAAEERKLEAAKLASKSTDTPEEKGNFWNIISGITGVLGEQNVTFKKNNT